MGAATFPHLPDVTPHSYYLTPYGYDHATLWFIDYRIKRSQDPSRARPGGRKGRHLFYAQGGRFVQV